MVHKMSHNREEAIEVTTPLFVSGGEFSCESWEDLLAAVQL
jgi:hypothetical protein